MEAFSRTVEMGYRWIETDLHLTTDGMAVCLHDPTLDRTTNGRGEVARLPWREVRHFDAGYNHLPDQGYPFRGKGVRIPSLEEVARTFPDLGMVLELKADHTEEAVLEVIDRMRLVDRVIIGSFSDLRLARIRELSGGQVATSTGEREVARLVRAAWMGRRFVPGNNALQIPPRSGAMPLVTKRTVRAYHRMGLAVHVWTVNDAAQMGRLLDKGVDGIMTDRPDVLRDVYLARGIWR
jgi:glycerophosphoryl diester phosphodiesterase